MSDQPEHAVSTEEEEQLRRHGVEILWPCTQELLGFAGSENLAMAVPSVHALGQIADERTVDKLLSLLENDDLAEEAVVALSKISHPRIEERLLTLLSSSVPKVTAACAGVLWRFANRQVVDKLAPLVKAPHAPVRRAAIESMGHMGLSDALPHLFEALSTGDEETIIASLKALKSVKVSEDDQLIPKLSSLYESIDNPKIRATVVQAFTSIAGADMLSLAKKALRDSNPRVRANAVELIGAMPIPEKLKAVLLKPLIQEGENNRVLGNVAIALAKSELNTSIQILSKLLNSEEKWERASAVYAARFLQSDRVTQWLTTQFTSESDPDVLRNIIESLSYMPSPEVTGCFLRALAHENPLIRIGAAKSLGRLGEHMGEEHRLKLLDRENDPGVISEVVSALGRIADSSRIQVLARFLQHMDLRVQANTIEALAAIGTVEIIPIVEPFLNSSDKRVNANAAVACWNCGSLQVVDDLAKMLKSPNLKQRSSAMYAIGELGVSLKNLKNVRKYLLLISALREDLKRQQGKPQPPPPAPTPVQAPVAVAPPGSQVPAQPREDKAPPEPRPAAPAGPPSFPLTVLEELNALIGSGQLDEALAAGESALAGQPGNPYILFSIAEVHRRKGDVARACEAFERLHQVDREFINSHLLLAALHNRAQEIPQSLAEYFLALKVQLELVMGQIGIGMALLKEKRSSEASLLLKGLVGQFAIDSRLHFKAGKEYLRNRQPEIGLDHLAKAYLTTPTQPDVLLKLGIALLELGRFDEAARVVGRLRELVG
ncbi:MAG: HEAT repeat domain-containing protein, partial [Candidatus Riflebacteria bacterium]|nr:HEAT repeat domain-containing protein [Candidatus Riflebacteria bacterium]